LWAAFALGAHRTLWLLVPTQLADAGVVGATVAAALALAAAFRAVGARGPLVGVVLGALAAEVAGVAAWVVFPHRPLGGLIALLPALNVPLALAVAALERASRAPGADAVEGAAFTAALLAAFQALLLPAW
ncbi:MAG TPA: hypothetical protein VFS00_34575, partial [Polyangiaceae bacterium]|nr:hypothetical protein [Polyangiaceae bacterium]